MSEFVLDTSETRPARAAAAPRGRSPVLRPLLISGACAAVLAGFAVAASSVMADLVAPPKFDRSPAIGKGLASSWPDLKDGQPVKAGTAVRTVDATADAPAATGTRLASLPNPMAFAAGAGPEAKPPQPQPVANRPAPMRPAERIPVATEVAVVSNQATARIVAPGRSVATLSPRPSETVRARDEVAPPVEEAAKPREEAPHTREAAVEKPARVPAKASKVTAAAKPPSPEPAKVAAAKPAAPKAAAARQPVTHTAAAEADSDETEILGVKLPSLAPAGQKLKDSVSALGDAVRNAF